jgi:hypothetical protein
MRTAVRISSGSSAVDMNPSKKSPALIDRSPRPERATSSADNASARQGSSAAESACARLPPTVPR